MCVREVGGRSGGGMESNLATRYLDFFNALF